MIRKWAVKIRRSTAWGLLRVAEWIYPDEKSAILKDTMIYGNSFYRIDPDDVYKKY